MQQEKIKFKTQFTVIGEHSYSPTGERTEWRHTKHIDKNTGREYLAKDKEVAIYDLIQSHKEECEIENIIRRAVEGDYAILTKRHGQFMDITGCPSSIAEAQQFIMDSKEEFERLPKEIKAKFEYNPEMYIAEMSNNTESWLEKTGLAEHYRLEKEREKENATFEANLNKAMENLATGSIIKNTEVKTNE